MYRALIETTGPNRVALSQEEVGHLIRVRRARPGDRFIGLDGKGSTYLCSLERDSQGWHGIIVEELDQPGEPSFQVILGQALIKKDKFEWVIQKATEAGVSEIVPLITSRTELRLDGEREARRLNRWHKILAESVKQCRRSHIPRLQPPLPIQEFLRGSLPPFRIAFDEAAVDSLRPIIESHRGEPSCLVLVGPEGGWGEEDRVLFLEHGVYRVRLGPRVLRAETAGLSAISILQYELGDLSPTR